MHSHQTYAANLVNRTTARDIFDLAWAPEPEGEPTGRRRRGPADGLDTNPLRELHDTVMLYGGPNDVQAWGQKLAEAAGLERGGRPPTWALVLAPLLADIPEVAEPEHNGHHLEMVGVLDELARWTQDDPSWTRDVEGH